MLPELNNHLPVAPTQHRFRPNRSTTIALLPLTHQNTWGFNQLRPSHRSVTMSIDLFKVFDMVIRTKLISTFTPLPLRPNTKPWLSAYLKGRMACVRYIHATSSQRHTRTGVPQGSCNSPSSPTSSFPHTHTPITSPPPTQMTSDSQSSTDYTAAASALSEQAT